MANFYDDNHDLQFYVDRGIDWEPLVELTEYGYRTADGFKNRDEAVEFYREVLRTVGKFTAEEIAPVAAAIDHEGLQLVDGEVVFPPAMVRIFEQIQGLELHGLSVPRELGGSNAPLLVQMMAAEVMGRGDVSVMAHHSFHGGIAMAMLFYSVFEGTTEVDRVKGEIVRTRWQAEIAEIVRGEAWGCMDITEPNAGSDMAALRTKAEQDEAGNWYLTGQKIFITSGNGKYHFVVARTEKAQPGDDAFAGLKGLSMFLVKAYEDQPDGTRVRYATVERLEDKMGHKGSPTAAIAFDRSPAQLVGKRGEGFKLMLLLMNNARIGVGMESIGLCEEAYRMAKAYAEERPSMGKTIDRHEMIADYLDEMASDLQGMRALAIYACYFEEMARRSEIMGKLVAEPGSPEATRLARQEKEYAARSRRLTPLLKYITSEKAVAMSRMCVQIHGGVGYTKEYGAERLMRDAPVMTIYEGTSQIQALMAMKDNLLGVMKAPQEFVKKVAQARWRAMSAADPLERRVARLQTLEHQAIQHLLRKTAADKLGKLRGKPVMSWTAEFFQHWDPKRDFAYAMLHAERLTQIICDVVIVELLLQQARDHADRRDVLERYLERAEPRCRALLDRITSTGDRLIAELRAREAQDTASAAQ
jgi:alkylation response protein AidB-like acyl-CoA dehydrogenase